MVPAGRPDTIVWRGIAVPSAGTGHLTKVLPLNDGPVGLPIVASRFGETAGWAREVWITREGPAFLAVVGDDQPALAGVSTLAVITGKWPAEFAIDALHCQRVNIHLEQLPFHAY